MEPTYTLQFQKLTFQMFSLSVCNITTCPITSEFGKKKSGWASESAARANKR